MNLARSAGFFAAFAVVVSVGACAGGSTAPPPLFCLCGCALAPTVASVTVTASASSINLGTQLTMDASVRDSSNRVVLATVTWTSSDQSVAIVKSTGVVYSLKAGTSRITGSVGAVTGFKDITVNSSAGATSAMNVAATTGSQFTPSSITLLQNGSVTWAFLSLAHNVSFSGAAGAPSDIATSSNADVQRSFTTKGTYNYTCTIHAGMSGTVIVQ